MIGAVARTRATRVSQSHTAAGDRDRLRWGDRESPLRGKVSGVALCARGVGKEEKGVGGGGCTLGGQERPL